MQALTKDKQSQDELLITIGANVLSKDYQCGTLIRFLENKGLRATTKLLCAEDALLEFENFNVRPLPAAAGQILHTFVCGNNFALKWWDSFSLLMKSENIAADARNLFQGNWEKHQNESAEIR